jgi:D-hydroxyproline dehydrogenase subunit gamma
MGVCFDCLVEIDGMGNQQACMREVKEGMNVAPQSGAFEAAP